MIKPAFSIELQAGLYEMTDETNKGVNTARAIGMFIAVMQAREELIENRRQEIGTLKKTRND